MNRSVWTIVKLNLKNIKVPYVITGILFVTLLIQDLIKVSLAAGGTDIGDQITISVGNYFWLLIPLAAIFIPGKNLPKIINLGGKRSHFFIGSLITYIILAAVVSLANILVFYFYDSAIMGTGAFRGLVNLLEVWGWSNHGPVVAFIQQFAFLFLVAAFTHTLTILQGSWYGWLVDILIVAVISIFIPVEPLRALLYSFFRMILFHPNALLQILSCIVLAAGVYIAGYPALCKKKI